MKGRAGPGRAEATGRAGRGGGLEGVLRIESARRTRAVEFIAPMLSGAREGESKEREGGSERSREQGRERAS
jgi:hypothetical protein